MNKINLAGLPPEIIAYITKLESQVQEQSTKIENQKVRIDNLMTMLANFQKTLYGQSSEKSRYVLGTDSNQLALFNEAEVEANRNALEPQKVTVSGHTRKAKRTKEELAAELPVVEILCELNEEEQICEECGGKLRKLGREIVREELEIIPAQVRVLRYIRQNYVCEDCEKDTGFATIVKAPTPKPVIKRSLASASTVAHVIYQKYVNGMPLNRQEKDWACQGVTLSRATLANWVLNTRGRFFCAVTNRPAH